MKKYFLINRLKWLRHEKKDRQSFKPWQNQSGQAMAEFTVFSPVLVIILVAIIFFGKGYYMKQKCYTAARYCAWYAGRHDKSEANNCRNLMNSVAFAGKNTSNITYDGPKGFGNIPVSQWFSGGSSSATGIIMSIFGVLNQADEYTVMFTAKVPKILQFMGSQNKAKSTHTVVADCWTWLDPNNLFKSLTSGVDNINNAPVNVN